MPLRDQIIDIRLKTQIKHGKKIGKKNKYEQASFLI